MSTVKLGAPKAGGAPRFPRGVYRFRITEEPTFKVSKKGNNMLVFITECCGPESKLVDGAAVDLRGWEFTVYAVFKTEDGSNNTLSAIHAACNLPLDVSFNDETGLPEGIQYTGLEFNALAQSKEQDMQDENGEVIRNPDTNEPLKQQQRQIVQIL